jgi:hypothetical protein
MTPRLITSDDAVQETHLQLHSGSQQVLTDLYIMVFMFLCEHPWDRLGTNIAIFQHCQHHSKCIETNIQLRTQFDGHNLPGHTDELIKALFISWTYSCAGLPGTWSVSHITVTIAEMHHPPPHCAHIHCLVSVNFQQASLNVSSCNFVRMKEFSDTPLLCMHFHVRHHFARLSPVAVARQQNLPTIGGKVQHLLPYHQHLPLTS